VSKNEITVNLADRQASMKLLKQLYTGAVKDDSVQVKDANDRRGHSPTGSRPVDEVHENTRYPHSKRR